MFEKTNFFVDIWAKKGEIEVVWGGMDVFGETGKKKIGVERNENSPHSMG